MSVSKVLFSAVIVATEGQAPADIYNQGPATLYGCECIDSCRTGVWQECDVLPYCRIKSNHCKHRTMLWGYDYCVWKPYQTYEELSAAEKQKMVFDHVLADRTSDKYPSTSSLTTGLFGESVVVSFNTSADVFPMKRKKYIHTVGVTGMIRFDSIGGHGYSGLFKDGAPHGLIRFSSAFDPSSSAGTGPGMGIKLFRDGRPSANLVAMYKLQGQPCSDKNFFAHDWHNHVPTASGLALELLAKKFYQASSCPQQVGISDFASTAAGHGKFPFMLTFHPVVSVDCPCADYQACLQNLEKLKAGTKLFDVLATATPGGEAQTIGSISLTSGLTTSKFGDEVLLFRHQLMEEDFQLEPSWLEAIDKKLDCGTSIVSTQAPTEKEGCTSPFGVQANTDAVEMMISDEGIIV